MAIITGVLNGGQNLNNDEMFQAGISHILSPGVAVGQLNECAVTTGSVATGKMFVQASRTSVTPNETFLVPVTITTAQSVSTSGTGYIILKLDDDMIDDGALILAQDGSLVATLENVASLPARNYLTLATLASGVITDARTYARVKSTATEATPFYGVAAGTANALTVTIPNLPPLTDGLEINVKAFLNNTTAVTISVNGGTSRAIRKKYDDALIADDINANQHLTLKWDATNTRWQMTSEAATSGAGFPTEDIYKVKISATDTTTSYLQDKLLPDDSIKKTINSPSGNANMVLSVKGSPFGDGSDGAQTGALTITGSNDTRIVKQYTSMAPGANTITITPTGCDVDIYIQGDCNLTGTTINFAGKGKLGGAGGHATSNSLPMPGGAAGGDGYTAGLGGGEGGKSTFWRSDGGGGTTFDTAVIGNKIGVQPSMSIAFEVMQSNKVIAAHPGAGGAGGGSGMESVGVGNTARDGGAGGNGGGKITFYVGGNLTFSSTTVNVSGANGSPGTTMTNTGILRYAGGGGGGAGGFFFAFCLGTITGSPTVTATGGQGGLSSAWGANPAGTSVAPNAAGGGNLFGPGLAATNSPYRAGAGADGGYLVATYIQ